MTLKKVTSCLRGTNDARTAKPLRLNRRRRRVRRLHDKIHIRKSADAPGKDPALCGRTHRATITEAWGYWGPGGGAGFDEVCRVCYAAQIARGLIR